MTRILVSALLLALTVSEAAASYAPLKYTRSRSEIASTCQNLGGKGRGFGLNATSGRYGCANVETGNTVRCEDDGRCTDYSGDPRRRRIEELLRGKLLLAS